jgi:hypothetical protein
VRAAGRRATGGVHGVVGGPSRCAVLESTFGDRQRAEGGDCVLAKGQSRDPLGSQRAPQWIPITCASARSRPSTAQKDLGLPGVPGCRGPLRERRCGRTGSSNMLRRHPDRSALPRTTGSPAEPGPLSIRTGTLPAVWRRPVFHVKHALWSVARRRDRPRDASTRRKPPARGPDGCSRGCQGDGHVRAKRTGRAHGHGRLCLPGWMRRAVSRATTLTQTRCVGSRAAFTDRIGAVLSRPGRFGRWRPRIRTREFACLCAGFPGISFAPLIRALSEWGWVTVVVAAGGLSARARPGLTGWPLGRARRVPGTDRRWAPCGTA